LTFWITYLTNNNFTTQHTPLKPSH